MKDKKELVYSLNIEDIQTVAGNEIGRELTDDEIEIIVDMIGKKINWYDVIHYSIIEAIDPVDQ